MNTSQLKPFAQNARRQLMELVSTKLSIVLDADSAARRENEKAVKELEKEISRTSENQVVEKVAYIWFNRFCALRFMDVNRYTSIGVVSPALGLSQPEILMEAKQGHIDEGLRIDKGRVFGLLNETIPSPEPQQEAYRMLLVAVCNAYYSIMPFLFEKIADYTELLMPDDLLSDSSILTATRESLSEEACADVEVIGWLYQFYISEKKDDVFAGLKKNKKVTPENIPAATQLFTPNWIVRYLVENSLGRLWMLNNPGSRLIDEMAYYIKPEQEETDFLVIKSPEEIKICDPACGSGHMLVYAFEILYAIYEEQGYDAPKIPQLILENNLYGIEIDERAGELAAFALCMKAREKYRRFFKKKIYPNICVLENVTFESHEVKSYLDAVNPDLFTMELSSTLYQFKEADNFGSLIRPELTNIPDVLRLIDEKKVADDIFLQGIHQRVLKVLKQAEYLSQRYNVFIVNPPYMNNKGMNGRLGKWAGENYPDTKADLFAMFMDRIQEWASEYGVIGFMTPFTWMFLGSYEALRNKILNERNLYSLVKPSYTAFFQSAIVPICAFIIDKNYNPKRKGKFFDLGYLGNAEEQPIRFLKAKTEPNANNAYSVCGEDFKKVPGSPIAFWISNKEKSLYEKRELLGEVCYPRKGLDTGENKLFLRLWYEVSSKDCCLDNADHSKRWFPYNKGGNYRKWYGNREYLIEWENNGENIKKRLKWKNKKPTIRNADYYFREGFSWTTVSSSGFSARYCPQGALFDNGGSTIFSDSHLMLIGGFINSRIMNRYLEFLSPTLNFQPGDISRVLFLKSCFDLKIPTKECIEIAKIDWDSYETSWDFTLSPLLDSKFYNSRLQKAYERIRLHWKNLTNRLLNLEENNNSLFIKTYDLQDELKTKVGIKNITLFCNPYHRYPDTSKRSYTEEDREDLLIADSLKEFISYSVGCMFGRYSLDERGLILANQGEAIENFLARIPSPTFKPDDDNVIPIMDVDWFPDDIVERFKRFLKVTFGEEHYEENLDFVEKAIGKNIRKFFLKEFYTYHVKMYKKRPIYWMFSSPKGSFNALIYMHRYKPDTVSIVLNDYLREFRTKLRARKDNLENISISTAACQGEKTKALKEIEKIKKVLDEVDDYERDILYPLATKQIEIDLDDGVKENYPKFGKALKKVIGLSEQ